MKQTAIEWLLENLISETHSEEDFKYNSECWDKAKAMEKEQIISFLKWVGDGYDFQNNAKEIVNEYYNETFKSE